MKGSFNIYIVLALKTYKKPYVDKEDEEDGYYQYYKVVPKYNFIEGE